MSEMQGKQRSAVVFGARNLGRAVIELLVSDGWAVAGVARSRSTLDGVSAAGALALKADVTDPASVYGVLEQAAAAHGGVELVLNAAAAYGGERTGPFGGGPIAEADLDGFDSWAAAPARAAFSFLSASGRFAIAQGRAATLVQVTGGSARRAMPGRGLWAAGSFGLPPLIVQAGTHEVLLDDAVRLARQAASADVEVTLEIAPRVPHVFQAYSPILDEAAAALDRAGQLLSAHLAGAERVTA